MTGSLFGLHFSLHKSFPRVTEVLPFIDGDFCGKCRNAIMDIPGGRLHQPVSLSRAWVTQMDLTCIRNLLDGLCGNASEPDQGFILEMVGDEVGGHGKSGDTVNRALSEQSHQVGRRRQGRRPEDCKGESWKPSTGPE